MPAQDDFWQLLRGSGTQLEATIAGHSMLPTLSDAARVRIRSSAKDVYAVGDVVVCVLKGELFAHRVVRRNRWVLVTIGDNRRLCDPPSKVGDVLGVVDAYWCDSGWRMLPSEPVRPLFEQVVTDANAAMLVMCARLHYGMARRVQGTLLHVGRLPQRFSRKRVV